MRDFIYDVPTKIYFGPNQLTNLGSELNKYGKNVLITYGGGSIKRNGLYDRVINELNKGDFNIYELANIEPNPRVESVIKGAQICKENNIDVVLAIGGGSTIDCSKFICAAALEDFNPWMFFTHEKEVTKALPLVTILTLAATGSEMNSGGVISNLATNEKIGSGGDALYPRASFLDPTVTYTVSKYQTACGSADILSHIMEVYFSVDNNFYMLDSIMESLMKTVIKYTPIALEDPENYEARANIMWASTWAINTFIEEGKEHDWSCHSIEHQLSAYYDITHGLGLAILTPRWLRYCMDDTRVEKIAKFGTNVFNIPASDDVYETANKAIAALEDFFFNTCHLDSTLTSINIDDKYFEEMAAKAVNANGTINGFKHLTKEDVINIYKMCL